MSLLVDQPADSVPLPQGVGAFGARLWVVSGQPHRNTAAKFWSSLLDESLAMAPPCDSLSCQWITSQELHPGLLFPEHILQQAMDASDVCRDPRQALREAIVDMTAFGPPADVSWILRAQDQEFRRGVFPADCVDADLFPFLVAWLLNWAGISPPQWHQPELQGAFEAADPIRHYRYSLACTLTRLHLSEGLFQWQLGLPFRREVAGVNQGG